MRPALFAALVFLGCASAPSPAPSSSPDAIPLVFGWPEALVLDVQFSQTKQLGEQQPTPISMTYRQESLAQEDGLRKLASTALKVTLPEGEAGKAIEALPVPALVIDAKGDPVRVEDLDRLLNVLLTAQNAPEERKDELREVLLPAFESGLLDDWRTSIGYWRGRAYVPDEEQVHETTIVFSGEPIQMRVTSRMTPPRPCRESAPEQRCVRLTAHIVPLPGSREKVGEGIARMWRNAAPQGVPRFTTKDVEFSMSTELLAEPGTLIPWAFRRAKTMRAKLVFENGSEHDFSSVEQNDYTYSPSLPQ